MVELTNERIEQILQEETAKKEELGTILRGIYTRYMCLFEKYFADIDALNDEKIAELRTYHEETCSLFRYYYMDIPLDICTGVIAFENKYSANMLGAGWHEFLFNNYEEYKEANCSGNISEEVLKAAFSKEALSVFYDAMDYIFRDYFGTNSQIFKDLDGKITGHLFGKE